MPYQIAGREFSRFPIGLGAGWCKRPEHVQLFLGAGMAEFVDVVVIGSILEAVREGNLKLPPVFWMDPEGRFAINSVGMPTPGRSYYADQGQLAKMISLLHQAGVQAWVNVAGDKDEEYGRLTVLAVQAGADVVEHNYGCPNQWAGSAQTVPASYNPHLLRVNLIATKRALAEAGLDTTTTVSIKLSPIVTIPGSLAEEVAAVIADDEFAGFVRAVTLVNTLPNASALHNGKPAIGPAGGYGGMSGPALFGIALASVRRFASLLPTERIALIGQGGVRRAQDVEQLVQAGASGVLITTAALDDATGFPEFDGGQVFRDIRSALAI